MRFLLGLFASLIIFIKPAQSAEDVLFKALPAWVEKVSFSLDSDSSQPDHAAYDILLNERQSMVDANGLKRFFRDVKRINSTVGVESLGNLLIGFDPSYQTLVWHEVKILRDGQWLDRKIPEKFETFRQEGETDSAIYSGNLTSSMRLEDLRVGDVLDISYSREGSNPIIGDHLADYISYADQTLTQRLFYRATVPLAHGLKWFSHGARTVEPVVDITPTQRILTLDLNHVEVEEIDSNTPGHYYKSFLQVVGDYQWADIGAWGTHLFASPLTTQDQTAIQTLASELTAEQIPLSITQAIRWVQDEIRYTGLEFADNALRPYSPAEVLERRFGDCKDKSLLLIELLRAMGVKAYPVLARLSGGEILNELLPNHSIFDHAIVAIEKPDGGIFWVDPTITLTGGNYPNISQPDYGRVVLLADKNSQLMDMQAGLANRGRQVIKHEYKLEAPGEQSSFNVTTQYHGAEADRLRHYLASSRKEEVANNYEEYYEGKLETQLQAGTLEWNDDRDTNILTTYETYTAESLWIDNSDTTWASYFTAHEINDVLTKVKPEQRSLPLNFTGINKVDYEVNIKLYEAWPKWKNIDNVLDDAFIVKSTASISSKTARMKFSFERLKDSIEANRITEFNQHIDALDGVSSYRLTTPKIAAEATTASTVRAPADIDSGLFFALAFGLLLGGMLFRWLHKTDPEKANNTKKVKGVKGLRGWLVLLGIIIIFQVLSHIYLIYVEIIFAADNWNNLSNQLNQLGLKATTAAMLEVCCDAMVLLLMTLAMFSFFKKRTNFPTVLTIALLAASISLFVNGYINKNTDLAIQEYESKTSYIGIILWITYAWTSARVANTFTNRYSNKPPPAQGLNRYESYDDRQPISDY